MPKDFVRWATEREVADGWHTDNLPPGYRVAWRRLDDWSVIAGPREIELRARALKCRHSVRHPCPNLPVAVLWRRRNQGFGSQGRPAGQTAWGYCGDHMYGNKIHVLDIGEPPIVIGLCLRHEDEEGTKP